MKRTISLGLFLAGCTLPLAGQSHGSAVEVPLMVENGRFFVPVHSADGTELRFMVSTGTPPTVYAASTVARLGESPQLKLGSVALNTENAATLPDSALTIDGKLIDGIVGLNTLSEYDVMFDAPGNRLVLKDVGRSVRWDGIPLSDPIRLRLFHGVIISMDADVNGQRYNATLDISSPRLLVNAPLQAKAQIDDEDAVTLTLGSTRFADVPVSVRDMEMFDRWDPTGNGFVVVGSPVALDCAITISWVHSEMRTCVR